MAKKLLLSGVFGPFGVDDEYGRKENVMELFHNQVTKAQGVASMRFQHRSFGLYFLAENIDAPVTVLDFPTRDQFIQELRSQTYDAVGISFIAPNFAKAREMARLVRRIQPKAEIILGGHGAAIEDVEKLIDCDHVVKGEGIMWLRRYLGEEPCRPIKHPILPSAEGKRLYGVPAPGVCALLVPGVGCVNACRFCSTSHFFDRVYTPYFSKGEELFREACRISDALKTNEFFVMDENFLKDTQRAHELLAAMQQNNRPFQFGIFSSAEAIEAFGVENMARLGVFFVWIGAESKRETYEKNKGRNLKNLVKQMRDHGIYVLVSGILFSEHHTKENIQEDIDFIVDLEGVYTQFMMLTPLPTTALYKQYKEQGRLKFDLPYEEWHGQKKLNFTHPNFSEKEAEDVLNGAFKSEYDRLSSSAYRMCETALRGYLTLDRLAKKEPWMAGRRDECRVRAEELRLIIPVMARFAHNAIEKSRALDLDRACVKAFGPLPAYRQMLRAGARLIAEAFALSSRIHPSMRQPPARRIAYHWPDPKLLPEHTRVNLPVLNNA